MIVKQLKLKINENENITQHRYMRGIQSRTGIEVGYGSVCDSSILANSREDKKLSFSIDESNA